tara:strand:+ start:319 stop:528 length:210 start_codon:yes stop_codon:yes gene_type:complete
MSEEDSIEEYKKAQDVIRSCINDLDRNIKLARKEGPSEQLDDMLSTRKSFLKEWESYEEFIKDLNRYDG